MEYEDIIIQAEDSARVDILWDDWSDQSTEHSEGVFTRCRRAGSDGLSKPLRLAFGRWHRPKFVDSPYVVDWPLTVVMHAYNIVKGIGRDICNMCRQRGNIGCATSAGCTRPQNGGA